VRNPLQNEESAFRFVLGTIAYFTPIVIASWIATWLGVLTFVAVTGIGLVRACRSWAGRQAPPPRDDTRAAVEDTRRILVVGNETLLGDRLREAVLLLTDGVAEDVLIVCPGVEASDDGGEDGAEPLDRAVEEFRAAGVNARGEASCHGPLTALEDALLRFDADEIVISTFEEGRSAWLEGGVVEGVRERFDGPVTHVSEPAV
jgi:hypothetical protein